MGILIPRSVWEAQYANGFGFIGTSEWDAAGRETWLHHSVTGAPGPDATLAEDCAHMRHIESIGQANYNGGISYTAIVMPSGRAFEGHSLDRQGSHTYQRNNRARAICFAGNYDTAVPSSRMLNTAAAILREWGTELDGGHRDVFATACPGQHAYARIGTINDIARSGNPIEGDDDVLSDNQDKTLFATARLTEELHAVVVSGAKRDARLNEDLGFVIQVLSDKIDNVIADVDEEALAAAMEARGIGGVSAAGVKEAFREVLGATRLTPGTEG